MSSINRPITPKQTAFARPTSTINIYSYGGTQPLPVFGTFNPDFESNHIKLLSLSKSLRAEMVAFQAKGSRAMARPTPWVSPSCCHTRLNFGTSSADEVFQDAIQQVFSGIHGVHNVSDDIISFGRDQVAHDRALRACYVTTKQVTNLK